MDQAPQHPGGGKGCRCPRLAAPAGVQAPAWPSREGGVIILTEEPRPSWDSPALGDGDTSAHIASVPQRTERSEDQEMSEPEGPGVHLLHCPFSAEREFEAGE